MTHPGHDREPAQIFAVRDTPVTTWELPLLVFTDADQARLRPLFTGVRDNDRLVAALKIAAERFAYEHGTGIGVLQGWRQSVEELTATTSAPSPPDPRDVVRQLRDLFSASAVTPDLTLLGARLAVDMPSAPLDRLLDLQAADDMPAFWKALVRVIASVQEPSELTAALATIRRDLHVDTPANSWEAEEAASVPGAPGPATLPHEPPAPRALPLRAVPKSPAPPQQLPPHPAALGPVHRVRILGVQGLTPHVVHDAIANALGCSVPLPRFNGPFIKDSWGTDVPVSIWQRASRGLPRLPVETGCSPPLTLVISPRQPLFARRGGAVPCSTRPSLNAYTHIGKGGAVGQLTPDR